jgi:hypothetical protein
MALPANNMLASKNSLKVLTSPAYFESLLVIKKKYFYSVDYMCQHSKMFFFFFVTDNLGKVS